MCTYISSFGCHVSNSSKMPRTLYGLLNYLTLYICTTYHIIFTSITSHLTSGVYKLNNSEHSGKSQKIAQMRERTTRHVCSKLFTLGSKELHVLVSALLSLEGTADIALVNEHFTKNESHRSSSGTCNQPHYRTSKKPNITEGNLEVSRLFTRCIYTQRTLNAK